MKKLLTIDGSHGEGGGQILRTAVALSVLTQTPVEIKNIRSNRPNPGLRPQHYIVIKSLEELCNAKTEGVEVDSSHLTFEPDAVQGGNYKFNIGTAGSIVLVLQTCILSCLKTEKPITIRISGGTDVKWSPTWDYFRYVFLPLIKQMGVIVDAHLVRRGYYPKGGGEAYISIQPIKKLHPLDLDHTPEFKVVKGSINIANLPMHISNRIKHTAIKTLLKKDLKTTISVEETKSFSPGVGITLWTKSENAILGSTMLGEKGVPSEQIGEEVASAIIKEIDSGATVDIYAFDQLLPYMAVAKNEGISSCIVRKISSHANTNMWVIQQFLDIAFKASQDDTNIHFTVG